MGKRNIFWWVQQIDDIGGAEMVSINLANHLVDDFNVNLIVSSEIKKEIVYQINPNIKIINMGFKKDFIRFDQYTSIYRQNHQYLNILKLFTYTIKMIFFKRNKIRKKVNNFLNDDDILIASSLDSYLFAPKKKKVYFHFHFDEKNFLSFITQFMLKMTRKPDKWIFLSDGIRNEIIKKKPKLADKSVAIINPTRFEPTLDLNTYNNHIIFLGRYAPQKNPLLALKSINSFKKFNIPFHFDMYGMGSLENKIKKYVKEHNLSDEVSVNPPCKNPETIYSKADLLLMTSKFEGLVLVKLEANAFSVPAILRNWGNCVNDVASEKESIIVNSDNPDDYAIAISKILDKNDIKIYRNNAYEFSKKFTYEKIMPIWRNLLNEKNKY